MIKGSSAIDSHVAANPSKLNSDNVGRNGSRRSSSMRRFKPDLSYCFERVVSIIDPSFAPRTELDSFHKRILCGRLRTSHRILKGVRDGSGGVVSPIRAVWYVT